MVNIEYIHGKSIFESDCDVLINPVNCVGVMGAGLALQFAKKFPTMLEQYKEKCESGRLQLAGYPAAVKDSNIIIILFPTKYHWKDKSDLNNIEHSLFKMIQVMNKSSDFHNSKIACPRLGCGLGGLSWVDVRPKVEYYLAKINCKGCEIYV